jgi:hypothetical protein
MAVRSYDRYGGCNGASKRQREWPLGGVVDGDADIAATNRVNSQRFARIEEILAEHSEVLADLPEAIHRRFGFRPPEGAS